MFNVGDKVRCVLDKMADEAGTLVGKTGVVVKYSGSRDVTVQIVITVGGIDKAIQLGFDHDELELE